MLYLNWNITKFSVPSCMTVFGVFSYSYRKIKHLTIKGFHKLSLPKLPYWHLLVKYAVWEKPQLLGSCSFQPKGCPEHNRGPLGVCKEHKGRPRPRGQSDGSYCSCVTGNKEQLMMIGTVCVITDCENTALIKYNTWDDNNTRHVCLTMCDVDFVFMFHVEESPVRVVKAVNFWF